MSGVSLLTEHGGEVTSRSLWGLRGRTGKSSPSMNGGFSCSDGGPFCTFPWLYTLFLPQDSGGHVQLGLNCAQMVADTEARV